MFTMPFSPSLRQLESAWRDLWADPLVHTRYNAGLLSLEEVKKHYLTDYLVCLSLSRRWTILNWMHDIAELDNGERAGWSGGWVSPLARGPDMASIRCRVHTDVVEVFYRSLGITHHGAAVIMGNLAGMRHTENIGYHPVGWAPDFAPVKRIPDAKDLLTSHSIWCWDEDDARLVWDLAMQRTQGTQVPFDRRQLISNY